MRGFNSRVGSSAWLAALLFGAWRVANIFLAEKLPADYPRVTDGYRYIGIARRFLESGQIDSYRVMRIAPSGVVHGGLEALGLPYTNENIVLGFEVLNLVALCTAAYAVVRILRHLGVGTRARELALVLLLVNYPMLKYSVFYPALTDFSAIGLGSLLLLFYLKDRTWALVLTSLVGAFTWPVLFYQGLILLVFPREDRESERLPRPRRRLLSTLSAAWGFGLLVYFVVLRGLDTYTGSLRLEAAYVVVAALFLIPLYFFLPTMLFQRAFFDLRAIAARIQAWKVLAALLLFACVWLLQDALVTQKLSSTHFGIGHFLSVQVLYGSVRPLINLVAHTTFYGCLTVLLLIFWKPFGIAVARRGLGLVLAFLFNFYLILLASESRQLSNLLPWFVVFLCLALDRFNFPRHFAPMILILNVAASKVWLPMGNPWFTQRHMMSNGPWMSEDTWLLQLVGFGAIASLLFFSLFRLRFRGGFSIERAPGFTPRDPLSPSPDARSIPLALWIGVVIAAPLVSVALR